VIYIATHEGEGKRHAEDMLKKQREDAHQNANGGAPSTTEPTPKKRWMRTDLASLS
jgi:hypothetical protein